MFEPTPTLHNVISGNVSSELGIIIIRYDFLEPTRTLPDLTFGQLDEFGQMMTRYDFLEAR